MYKYLHFFYWFLIFNIGTLGLLGLPSSIYKIGIPLLTIIFFLTTLHNRAGQIRMPLIFWVVLFSLTSLFSAIYNEIKMISLIQFYFITLNPYFYFVVIINEKNIKFINSITKWIIALVLLQIPVIIVKYLILGQSEKGAIGTLSTGDGSLSTVFPTLIIAFLISYYLFSNRIKYLFFIICFILFGIIGKKRAITFLIPLEFLVGYIMFSVAFVKNFDFQKIRQLALITIGGMFAFYLMVRTNPTLNPENKVWGSFDIDYVVNYSDEYTSENQGGKAEMRRKDGLIYFFNYRINSKPFQKYFGDGSGILVQTNLNDQTGTMLDLYGVRYGGRMGFIWVLLQVGFLGLFFYLGLIFGLIRHPIKNLPLKNNFLLLGFLLASIFMLFDFFLYSSVFISLNIIGSLYFYVAALLFKGIILTYEKNENDDPSLLNFHYFG